jgi:hypothetical protein
MLSVLLKLVGAVVSLATHWQSYVGLALGYLFPGDIRKIWNWVKSKFKPSAPTSVVPH